MRNLAKDKKTGRFARSITKWSIEKFNEGYLRKDGRFFVYYPEHHRATAQGYVLRSIIAYEYYHNDIVTKEFCIHHIDHNKSNDTKENLVKLPFREHSILHATRPKVKCICIICDKIFYLPQWRIAEGKGNFCSRKCSQKKKVSEITKEKISNSNKGRISGMKGKKQSEKQKNILREKFTGIPHPKVECPICNAIGGLPAMKRWHFENCKEKICI